MLVLFMIFIFLVFVLVITTRIFIIDTRYSESVTIDKITLMKKLKEVYMGEPYPESKIKEYINNISLSGNNIFNNDKALTETGGLITACKTLEKLLVNSVTDEKVYEKTKSIINIIYTNLEKKINHNKLQVPYGSNWYEFSISIPFIYINHIIVAIKRNDTDLENMIQKYCTQILKINVKPNKSYFSINRDGPNAAMMGYTYWISKIMTEYKFSKYEFYNDNVTEKILNLYYGNYVNQGEGIYSDGTYIFHTNVRAYGYIIMLLVLMWFYDYMVGNTIKTIRRKEHVWSCLRNIIHPTIKRIGCTLINRNGEYLSTLNIKNAIKLPHLIYMSIGHIVSYMATDFTIQYMCATKKWAAYETKRQEDRFYYVNVLGRRLLTNNSAEIIVNGEEMYEPGILFYESTNYKPSRNAINDDVHSYLLDEGWSYAKILDNIMVTISYQKHSVYVNSLVITILTPLGMINSLIFNKHSIRSRDAALCVNSGKLDANDNIDGMYNKMLYINTNTPPTLKPLSNNRMALMYIYGNEMYMVDAKLKPETESHVVLIYATSPHKIFNENIKIKYTNINVRTNKEIIYVLGIDNVEYKISYDLNDFILDNNSIPTKNINNLSIHYMA